MTRRALAGLLLLATSACGGESDAPPNVLLIVIDTLRADRLGSYGYELRDTSPRIDEFGRSAVRFQRAYAAAAWTRPSVASILTGLQPAAHGANTIRNRLDLEVETLAESLRAAGFATGGVVSNAHLLRRIGFAQGFDLWSQTQAQGARHISSAGVTDEAIGMLDELVAGGRPWFLFVHYFDPHYAYLDHDGLDFAPAEADTLSGDEEMTELEKSIAGWSQADLDFVTGRYDEEIRFTDRAIGELLDRVREYDALDRSWIVITADHGEEFGDHGSIGHGNLHDEVIRVPLLIRPPGGAERRAVEQPVSLLALVPTLLEVTGVPHAAAGYDAASLAGWLVPGLEPPAPQPLFSELKGERAIIEGDYKLILETKRRRARLYDLVADPAERRDIAETEPRIRRRLARLYALRAERVQRREASRYELDEEQRELLRDLGYLDETDGTAAGEPR
jgi:arylsulfatase A-like enzyme